MRAIWLCALRAVIRDPRDSGGRGRLKIGGALFASLLGLLFLLLALGSGDVSMPRSASAAFPGANGKILFSSFRDGDAEIYVMNADGTGQTNLTNNTVEDGTPRWSPDGSKIVFHHLSTPADIWKMNADGSAQTQLTSNSAHDSSPTWSPNGASIAFTTYRDGSGEIYVMNADGTGQTNLTNNAAEDTTPSWSPNGSKIVFQSNRVGNNQIYVMNADGTGQTRLSNNAFNDVEADWSPGGSKIAFESDRVGNNQIYVMNADGTGQTRLSNNAFNDDEPQWSPDGSKIVFRSSRDGNEEIYVMNADGTGQTNLTNNSAIDREPVWQPIASPTPSPPPTPTPPFNQCPPVGQSPSCGVLIVFNADGSTTVLTDPSVPPFDAIEDTLVGAVNNSSSTVSNVILSGPDIFGFDSDGLCFGYTPGPVGCPFGPTGYEGPNTSFTVVNSNNGTVNFTAGGLAPNGGAAYFSLEGNLVTTPPCVCTTPPTPTPHSVGGIGDLPDVAGAAQSESAGPKNSDSGWEWPILVLAGAGVLALGGYGAWRLRSKRSM